MKTAIFLIALTIPAVAQDAVEVPGQAYAFLRPHHLPSATVVDLDRAVKLLHAVSHRLAVAVAGICVRAYVRVGGYRRDR